MLNHEFGLMDNPPAESERIDEYNLEKYESVISVDDDIISQVCDELNTVQMYWHTLQNPQKGLAYDGITIIPPRSTPSIRSITEQYQELDELTGLLDKATIENKYVIHFGI